MMKLHPPHRRGRQLGANRAVGFLFMGVLCLSVAGVADAQLAGRLEQASNGTPDAPISAVDWVTTTITPQRGHYVEGSSIPYRLVFDTLLPGAHRVVIAWDAQTSGRRATDYLTYYNRLLPHNQFGPHNVPETIQPLRGISGGPSGPATFPIPSPAQPPASFQGLPPGQRAFHIYNGTITGAAYLADGSTGSTESRMEINFTASDVPVVILFGGHVAAKDEYGAGQTAGGAAGLNYRMRVVEMDGLGVVTASVTVNATAVVSPPTCNISGPDPVCPVVTNTYTASSDATNATFSWMLPANTSGATIIGASIGPAVQVRSGDRGGTFTLQVAVTDGPLQSVCSRAVTVLTNASITPLANAVACPGGMAVFSTVASGTGPFAYLWRKGETVLPGETNSQLVLSNVGPSHAGLYCVDVTDQCNTVTSCATLTIYSNTTATALPNLSRCVGDGAVFVTTAGGTGPFTYRWRKNGLELNGQTNRILSIPTLTLSDAGTYAIEVTGLCNSVTNSGQLVVYALPVCGIQGPASICPQSSGNVFVAPVGMAEYRWRLQGNGGAVGPTNQQNVVVTGGLPGFFMLNLTTVNSNGCSRTCSRTITVGDIQPPVVTCPQNIQTNTEPGQCSRAVSFAVSASDDCDGVTVSCNPPSGTRFAKGTTTVNCTATDGAGNQASCSFTVTVTDQEKPVLSWPTNLVVNTQPGTCEAAATYNVTVSDNCPGATVTCSPPSGSVFPLGTSSVSCRGSDASGNIALCTFDVTVQDHEAPQIMCSPDLLVVVDPGQCDVLVDYEVQATDNCAMARIICTPASGSLFGVGQTMVECVAMDVNQNQNRCTFIVEVVDGEKPQISCPGNISVPCESGRCDAAVSFAPTASDNCGEVMVSCVPPSGARFSVGQTNVTCTAKDGSGNSASCTFKVTVSDSERPVLVCPSNMVVNTATGRCDAVVQYTPRVTDNCPGAKVDCVPPSGSRFAKGGTTVNCYASDASSNAVSCAFSVTVQDAEPPRVTCPGGIVTNALAGQCAAVVNYDLFPTDNCPGVDLFCDWPSGSTFPLGETWVYCVALDSSGNAQDCTFPVTVLDLERPVITCPADLTINTQTGRCDAVATFAPNASDNCGISAVTCVPPSGSRFSKGTNGVNCTARDASGNTATCAFRVIVQDREVPVVACPANIVTNTAAGRCDAVVTFAASATDNCGGTTVICTPPSGATFTKGVTTVNCTATDASGNTNRCSFTVTVNDGEPPVPICPANIATNSEPGRCDAVVAFASTASDNCSGTTVVCAPPSGTRFARGATPVTCTATDASGNTAACVFNVTVNDSQSPVAICPANIVSNTAPGRCDAAVSFAASATDNCPGSTVACTPPSGATFTKGVTTVNCTATDASGNTNRCTFTVTVQDREAPVVVCPANIVTNTAAGRCDAAVSFAASATDNCTGTTVVCTPSSGATFTKGVTTVNCVGTDGSGNTNQCGFTVTVQDREAPAVSCPANIVTNTAPGRCDAVVSFAASATDNCPGSTVACTPPSGATFTKGVTTVNCTATDASGNTNRCSFTVTVQDGEPPAPICPANIVTNTEAGRCDAIVTFASTAIDNCAGTTVVCAPPSGTRFARGATPVTCTATDASGNTATCVFNVTVNDNQPPVASCPADIVTNTASGRCDAVVSFAASATDNCTTTTVSCTPPSGATFAKGVTTVNCTATDPSGNTNQCSFTVTVQDREAPTVTCPANIVVNNQSGRCDRGVSFTAVGNDNCPGTVVVCTPASGTRFAVGQTVVTCVATDASGNTNRCSFTVTVHDNEPPTVVCPANIVTNTEAGRCDAIVTFSASATDNCPGTTVICAPPSGTRFTRGTNSVTCTATDASANSASCTFSVRVNDNQAPVATCPANIVTNTASGRCDAVVSFAASATDNCTGTTIACTPPSGATFTKGITSVNCTAADGAGNTNQCNFTVTVQDREAPAVTCPSNILTNTQPGRCDAVVSFAASATDNCVGTTIVCTPPSGATFTKGATTVNCTATDASGNTNRCSFTVTVQDGEAPVPICPANIATNTEAGRCDAIVTFAPSASDNCTGTTVVCVPASGSRFARGATPVTCTATDASGNTATCVFSVTVNDTQPPVANCPANIVSNTAFGRCDAVVSFAASATDNCSTTTVVCTPPSGATFVKGVTTVSCVATDASGNTNRCTFTVTVNDSEPPVPVCPANIVTNTESGRCDAIVTFAASTTDNCAGATVVCLPASGTRFARGTSPVTCTASDASGNTATCTFSVTVNDTQPPVANCPANIVSNTAFGRCDAVVTFAASATDNCSTTTVVCTPLSGATFVKGVTTVNCVATDGSGNTNQCSFTVTVQDREAPVATCPANIVTNTASGRCDAVVTFAVSASDNCGGTTVICSPPSGATFTKGVTTVNCTATDASGNTNRCSFTVTVNDGEPPVPTCPANIATNTEAGRCDAIVSFGASASDNCTGTTVVCVPASGSRFARGTSSVTCTATDANGNTAACVFNVTVNDNQPPLAICPANIVSNTAPGRCDAAVSFAASATDNCGAATVVCTPPSGATFTKGVTTVNCVAGDGSGNTNQCSFTVTVQDREAPAVTCPANIVTNSQAGRCDALVTFAALGNDNCAGTTVVCSPPSGSRFVVGQTAVTCVATDSSGNTNRCTFFVTVNDLERPEVICPADITAVTEPGRCDAQVAFTATAFDNCLGATVICVPPSGSRFARGPTVVACTATDASGNAAACAFTVIVNDNQAPTVSCPANIVTNMSPGRCDAVVSFVPTVTDNCSGTSVVCTPPSGGTFAAGVTTVNCVATDAGGNTNRCGFTVTVQDHEKPVITCPAAQELFAAPGTCDGIATFAATASDNCGGASITCSPPSGSRFANGVNTVTCTATDGSGNAETCSFTVTVRDSDPPALTCPTNIFLATETGRCDAIATFAPTVLDNCTGTTVRCVPPAGSRFGTGTTPVNCTALDSSSNQVTCSFTVTVEDREDPRLLCSTNVIANTASGRCDRVVEFAATVTDNCGAEVTCEPPSGSTFLLGTNTVLCTGTDASGNRDTCAFFVIVLDRERPAVACPPDITLNTEPGRCDAAVTFAANATDNCAVGTPACVPSSGSRFNKGVTTVTCTATDAGGNTGTCSFRVTVNDAEPPVIVCPQNLVLNTKPGLCLARPVFSAQVSDNCPGSSVACTPPSGSDFPIGITAVVCNATDASGNSRSCAFDVRVLDAEPPRLVCPGDLIVDTEPSECTATVPYAVTGEDGCNLTNLTCTPPSGSLFSKGVTLVQCSARDASGNESTCAFNVTVRDTERPTLLCPTNIVVSATIGRCDASVEFVASGSDNCGSPTVVCTPPSGATFSLGTTPVTCRATDAAGNTNQCTFTVRVIDSQRPVLTCPTNIVANCESNRCDATVNFSASAIDNCGSLSVSCTPPSGSRFNLGVTPVTCSSTDGGGNVGTCSFTVSVRDVQSPIVQCPANITANALPGRCDAPVTFNVTATDNCGAASVSCLPPSGSYFSVGTSTVTCSATDGYSNVGTCQFTVTVRDVEPPSLQCPADMLVNTATGRCDAVVFFGTQAFDNCSSASVTCVPPSGSTFFKGTNYVTCTARDASSNSNNCTFRVVVRDVEKPQIVCPGDMVVSTESSECRARVTFAPTATDNCSGVSIACNPPSNSWFNKGVTTVICVATDGSGNTNRCSFTVTVNDTTRPNITCPANIVTNATHGQRSAVVQFAPVVSDNCPGVSYICTPQSGSVFQEGSTPVTCTATDNSGNTRSCSFTVTVNDIEPPVINCPTNLIVATSTGRCDAVAVYTVTATDNSQMATIVCTPPSGSTLPKGLTDVFCIATDPATNQATCSFNITVVDLEPPATTCPANIVLNTDPGRCEARVTYTTNATDNCGIASFACTPPSGNYMPKGTNTVTCTATDTSGNTNVCAFTVRVIDNERPLITCPGKMNFITPPGQCTAIVNFNPTVTDNCPGATVSCVPPSGSDFGKGITTVNCTARDTSGNTSTCSFQVDVRDVESPVITCPADMNVGSYPGACGAPAVYSVTVRDNCPGVTLNCTPPSGTMMPVGTNLVTCNAVDTSGNTAGCSFRIIIRDVERPTLTCPGDIIIDGSNGVCSSVVTYTPTVHDNCPGTAVNCVPPSGTNFPQGANRVTCTAVDPAGNTASCAFSVINRLQPLAATPPQSQTHCAGETAVFATSASGSGPMTFAWFKDGVVMSGRTNTSLTLSNVTPADSAAYGVLVQTPCGSVSNSATLAVRSLVVVNGLTNLTKCDCDPLVLGPTVSGTGPYSYLWRKNGAVIPGATSNTLAFAKISTNDAGLYAVEVSGACNTASASASVSVIHVPNPAMYTNSGTITIYDNAPAFPYPSSVRVTCVPDTVKRATVTLRGFTHSYPDDVDVMLATPDGRCVMLMSDAGSGMLANNISITLDDSAAVPLPDSTQLFTGTFRPANYDTDSDTFPAPAPKLPPANSLAALAGTDPNGFWSLFVRDDFQLDSGAINNGWVLRLYWQSNPVRITDCRMLPTAAFQMTLTGDPQTSYTIEASSDLRTWNAIGTVTLTGPHADYTDPTPTSPRFYRAVQR